MKKTITRILVAALALALVLSAAACGGKQDDANVEKTSVTIAIPNDTTNEARALLLLESLGYITLKEGAGITATPLDIADNPYGIKIGRAHV